VEVRRFEIRIGEVRPAAPTAQQAVTLLVPATDDADADDAKVLVCAFPGGGYGRGYYDVEWKGSRSYSEAEHHASRGWLVACIDHLGVGDSSPVDPSVGLIDVAAADSAVTTKIAAGLRDGSLVPELGARAIDTVLGIGHSMGGYLLTVAQANHAPFDGVAILGSSAIHTVLPTPPDRPGDLMASLRYVFHGDDVDPEIVEADLEGFPARTHQPHWASATAPLEAVTLLEPGIQAREAAAITVPVFVGCGERDVVPDPWLEPSAYRASSSIALHVVERMGHMHNFARSRVELWRQLHAWGSAVALRQR
jgi:alpha-beta hydrolase superfamily lysophospholipase